MNRKGVDPVLVQGGTLVVIVGIDVGAANLGDELANTVHGGGVERATESGTGIGSKIAGCIRTTALDCRRGACGGIVAGEVGVTSGIIKDHFLGGNRGETRAATETEGGGKGLRRCGIIHKGSGAQQIGVGKNSGIHSRGRSLTKSRPSEDRALVIITAVNIK